jgi:hypothetical protein
VRSVNPWLDHGCNPLEGIRMTTDANSTSESDGNDNEDGRNAGSARDRQNSTDSAEGRAGRDLEREDLEKALAKARDDAAKHRQKAKYAFADEESFRRATEALSMLEKAEQERKSEVERLSEDREKLLYRASESERSYMRLKVALGAGIDSGRVDEFASRLRGNTEEEMQADAEHLAKLFTPIKPERRSDPSQGAGADSLPAANSLQAALQSKLGITH